MPRWVGDALKDVGKVIANMKRKTGKNALRWLDNMAASEGANASLAALVAAKVAPKPAPQPQPKPKSTRADGGSYAEILGGHGFARQPSAKGTQLWTRPDGRRCEILTKRGEWTLHAAPDRKSRGRLTPSLVRTLKDEIAADAKFAVFSDGNPFVQFVDQGGRRVVRANQGIPRRRLRRPQDLTTEGVDAANKSRISSKPEEGQET